MLPAVFYLEDRQGKAIRLSLDCLNLGVSGIPEAPGGRLNSGFEGSTDACWAGAGQLRARFLVRLLATPAGRGKGGLAAGALCLRYKSPLIPPHGRWYWSGTPKAAGCSRQKASHMETLVSEDNAGQRAWGPRGTSGSPHTAGGPE